MSIRRASRFMTYDENGEPYWQMGDDPEGAYVLYADHLVEAENAWEEAYAAGFNHGRAHGELLSCPISHKHGYEQGVQAARDAVTALPKEDGGYCHVIHACDVETALESLRDRHKR